jgi:hypothetical protein
MASKSCVGGGRRKLSTWRCSRGVQHHSGYLRSRHRPPFEQLGRTWGAVPPTSSLQIPHAESKLEQLTARGLLDNGLDELQLVALFGNQTCARKVRQGLSPTLPLPPSSKWEIEIPTEMEQVVCIEVPECPSSVCRIIGGSPTSRHKPAAVRLKPVWMRAS